IQERVHALVDVGAQSRHLALADPGHTHRLDEFVDRAGRDAVDIGLLNHRRKGLLAGPPRLEEPREVAAFAQLRDPELDGPGPGLPEPLAVAVAAVRPLRAALTVGRGA